MKYQEKTVANYVANNIKTAHVFKKYGIDFCCGGGITLEKACENNELDINVVMEELLEVGEVIENSNDYNSWELDFLIDYIVTEHHAYVISGLPLLSEYSNKVAKVHGGHYPYLHTINKLFHEVSNELISHLKKEEEILFPYVKKLVEIERNLENEKLTPPFGTVNNPVQMMEEEHEHAGDVFKEISRLTNNYEFPEGACNTFRALYDMLAAFEEDLHKHIHLENNILHPKAVALENKLFGDLRRN